MLSPSFHFTKANLKHFCIHVTNYFSQSIFLSLSDVWSGWSRKRVEFPYIVFDWLFWNLISMRIGSKLLFRKRFYKNCFCLNFLPVTHLYIHFFAFRFVGMNEINRKKKNRLRCSYVDQVCMYLFACVMCTYVQLVFRYFLLLAS